jgi:putative restriction endonuclease
MPPRNLWSREELILAFNVYLKLPFGKLHTGTPMIRELAELTGRTANSIALRMTNYAACDPYHQARGISGMKGGIKQCQPIWDEFFNNREALLFESERILAEKQKLTIESKFQNILQNTEHLQGEYKIREVKTRVNQNVFRQIVLANYSNQCAITGLKVDQLLIASHIIPWSVNEKERLNPSNGICLNALHDNAFDAGLIAINPADYTIVLSDRLKQKKVISQALETNFIAYENKQIHLPAKFVPQPEFLDWHLKNIFVR